MSFAELDQLTRDFAAFLQTDLELAQGDRVALMVPNLLSFPVCFFGALRAGLTVTCVNPLYASEELEHQLRDSGAKCVVVLANYARVLYEALPDTSVERVIVTRIGDFLRFPNSAVMNFVAERLKRQVPPYGAPDTLMLPECLARGRRLTPAERQVAGTDVALLQYTGGTTGTPKGAMLTHRNMIANLEQSLTWLTLLETGEEVVITALPLYHIFSLTANCLVFMCIGGLSVLIADPRNTPAMIAEMRKWKFTAIAGVNTLFDALLRDEAFHALDFSKFKLTIGGGGAVQQSVAEQWQRVTGVPMLQAYGLTEAAPAVCITPVDLHEFNGTVGLPLPSTDVSVRDDTGRETSPGEAGELWVRGPQVMAGYWRRPRDTAEVLPGDGWLKTGDVATVDGEGFIRILDRKKDLIIVSGFNVYPNQIEDVVVSHPGVQGAACIGVPDARTGEAVKVYVVPKTGQHLTEEDIRSYCREKLTGYKTPKHIEFREELPKSNVGKVLRRLLRD